MTRNDNPADPFKKALSEAARTMADTQDLNVTYSVDPPGLSGDTMRLPQVSRRMTRDEVLLARGTADTLALRHRYHDAPTHARYLPQGQMARDLYQAMEEARCEAVGARHMPGTSKNIDARIAHEATRKGYAQIRDRQDAPLAVAASYMIRHLATGRDLPEGAAHVLDLWRGFIEERAGGTLETLDDVLGNQAAFARLARQMIEDLGYGDQLGDDPDNQGDEDEGSEDDSDDAPEEPENPDSQGQDEEGDDDSEDENSAQDSAQADVAMDQDADEEMSDQTEMPEADAPLAPPAPPLRN